MRVFVLFGVCFVLAIMVKAQVSTHSAAGDSVITKSFLGFDPWSQDPKFWTKVNQAMDQDSAKFGLIGFGIGWEKIESEAPQHGAHQYHWSLLDSLMRATLQSGRQMDLNLLCRSDWGTTTRYADIKTECCGMSPLKSAAQSDTAAWGMTAAQAWGDFVRALVERYDGDGVDDAPGITAPAIRFLELGDEPEVGSHFGVYGGSPEAYDLMLSTMYDAAKEACADQIVVRGKSNSVNTFEDDPDSVTAYKRLPPYFNFVSTQLRLGKGHFDAYAINFNDNYTLLAPLLAYLKKEMRKNGYETEFMVSDARTTLYPRDNDSTIHVLPPRYPHGFIGTLANTGDPQWAANRRLSFADESRESLCKILVALGAGMRALSLQPLFQGPVTNNFWQEAMLLDARTYMTSGQVVRKAWKPVYHATKRLMDLLAGASTNPAALALGPSIYAYRFMKNGRPLIALWHEDPKLTDANGMVQRNQEVTVDLSAQLASSSAIVHRFVTELNASNAPVLPPDTVEPGAMVRIDEMPVVVEAGSVAAVDAMPMPASARLEQNHPNPFAQVTTIDYALRAWSQVDLRVYNILGGEVATLVRGTQEPGMHSIQWKPSVPMHGLYFYRLDVAPLNGAGRFSERKLMIIRD